MAKKILPKLGKLPKLKINTTVKEEKPKIEAPQKPKIYRASHAPKKPRKLDYRADRELLKPEKPKNFRPKKASDDSATY